jgi:DNA repair protein RadA/Sms
MGLVLGNKDIYINVVGGMKVNEPGIELSLAASIFSSLKNIIFPKKTAFIGEVGLSGELRGVKNLSGRVGECYKFGIEQVVIPEKSLSDVEKYEDKLNIISSNNIKEAIEKSFRLSGEEEFK